MLTSIPIKKEGLFVSNKVNLTFMQALHARKLVFKSMSFTH